MRIGDLRVSRDLDRLPAVEVVGVSGPDGAGKSRLVRGLRRELARRGAVSSSSYLYGCVFCRRIPEGAGRAVRTNLVRSGAPWRAAGSRLAEVHALFDAAELALRLAAATFALGLRSRRRQDRQARVVLLTDRSPLDGLAKHLPPARSVVARVYRRLARRYEVVLLLNAPAGVLAARDGDHAAAEIAEAIRRFEAASAIAPETRIFPIDAARGPGEVLECALARLVPAPPSRLGPDEERVGA